MNSNRVSIVTSKGSGASQLRVEIEGFKTGGNGKEISIHQITVNDKFADDLETMPFQEGFEVTLSEIANYFMVDESYDVGYVIDGETTSDLVDEQTTGVTVAITTAEDDPTSTSPFEVTITFSEEVSGFVVGDITVGNGSAGNLATSDNIEFTADITPAGDGEVTVDVDEGVATSAATGKNNVAAPQFSITYAL